MLPSSHLLPVRQSYPIHLFGASATESHCDNDRNQQKNWHDLNHRFGLKQVYAVKFVGGYIAVTFVVMEICYFGVWCRPFNQYWAVSSSDNWDWMSSNEVHQVPTDNIQCSAAIHHLIMNAVFNVTSDLMMLCIPLPLLIASKIPRKKYYFQLHIASSSNRLQ